MNGDPADLMTVGGVGDLVVEAFHVRREVGTADRLSTHTDRAALALVDTRARGVLCNAAEWANGYLRARKRYRLRLKK